MVQDELLPHLPQQPPVTESRGPGRGEKPTGRGPEQHFIGTKEAAPSEAWSTSYFILPYYVFSHIIFDISWYPIVLNFYHIALQSRGSQRKRLLLSATCDRKKPQASLLDSLPVSAAELAWQLCRTLFRLRVFDTDIPQKTI